MKILGTAITALIMLAGCATTASKPESRPPILIDDFESGNLDKWIADANWRVDDNSAGGWYSGWQGSRFAWSGQGGENTTGKLRSRNFVLERDGVEAWVAGWADIQGQTTDRWNYVTLNLADGTELDRVYAPNTTTFTQKFLRGKGHQGKQVYIEAVDNGAESVYSMICIDGVAQSDGPGSLPTPTFRQIGGVRLENDFYRVEVSRRNGVITRLLDKKAGVDFIREPRLAGNFKFTLPIRGEAAWQATEANYVMGEQQKLSSVKRDGKSLELIWRGPLTSVVGRTYDADVTMRVSLVEDQIAFTLAVDNRTDLEIGELFYPMLGGTIGLVPNSSDYFVDPKQTVMVVPGRTGVQSALPFQNFVNQSWLGIHGPEQHYGYPDQLCMPWLDFYQNDIDRGLYIGAVDPIVRYKVIHVEMFPGSSGPRGGGNWPTPEELGDRAAGLRVSLVHMPYSPPHTRFDASPVIVKAHAGDWRTAARLYGELEPVETGTAAPALLLECDGHDWPRLPELAKRAVDAGLSGILVRNWRTIPDNAGEPLFALPEEATQRDGLRAAIEQCHKLGAKVILSIGIEHASQLRPSYARLRDFACMDRWGVLDTAAGWGPATTHAQSLAGTERRVVLNPGAPAYRAILAEQTAALASAGADGIHVARFFGRTLDFNPKTEMAPDRAAWEGGLKTLGAMRKAGRKMNPGFVMLTDDSFDRLGAYADACGGPVEHSAVETAYPEWRKLLRIADPAKVKGINEMDLARTTVILAPAAGVEALNSAEWKTLIQHVRAGMKM
ncbi:MAG: hypothetical protein HZB26_08230 [Candidatus Hydrogenedentes bacterium]|nr:hypothetical protein [Candidatus Hydrogenedentota bacterium]